MSSTELVIKVLSSAYHLLARVRPQEAMSYPLPEALSQRISGSTMRSKSKGDSGTPCRMPLPTSTGEMRPWGVTNAVVAPLYKLETNRVKAAGRPRNSSTRTVCLWSLEENAPLKSM